MFKWFQSSNRISKAEYYLIINVLLHDQGSKKQSTSIGIYTIKYWVIIKNNTVFVFYLER